MKKAKDIELNADDLITALSDVRDHLKGRKKITMKTTAVSLPDRAETLKADEIKSIRRRLNVSQQVFARMLNVSLATEASWETGRRHPSGAAVRLLQIAKRKPDILLTC